MTVTVADPGLALKAAALLPKGIELAKRFLSKLDDKAQYDFRIAHTNYCVEVIKKFCRARTFFVRDEPQFVEDFYVPASVTRAKQARVERADLSSLLKVSRRTVVTGSGGSGKTIFMRHLLLDAIQSGVGYPVFIELRALNQFSKVDLEGAIVRFMRDHGFPLNDDLALRSLREGLLVVLLDGFDEVAASKRKALEAAIRRLGSTCASQIVVSSRPDMVLEGWDGFASVKIAPLELKEACELIQKAQYGDDEIKQRFIQKLKSGLFKSHQFFLSNPLLLSIMLITYGDSADIPRSFASFYEQAYTALFQKHDALKSGYRRERQTPLDIFGYAKMFAAFSAITYNKRLFRFSELDAISFVETAKKVVGATVEISAQGFLDDAKQAVCLLIDDGLDIAYVHRSFQEYFVARFISEADPALQARYIKDLVEKSDAVHGVDNVMKLLYELSPKLVEDNYLIPVLMPVFGDKKRKLSLATWKAAFSRLIASLASHDLQSISYSVENWREITAAFFLADLCDEKSRKLPPNTTDVLLRHFDESNRVINIHDLSPRSPVWRDLASEPGMFDMQALETLRCAYFEMLKRSKERDAAVGDAFGFD